MKDYTILLTMDSDGALAIRAVIPEDNVSIEEGIAEVTIPIPAIAATAIAEALLKSVAPTGVGGVKKTLN